MKCDFIFTKSYSSSSFDISEIKSFLHIFILYVLYCLSICPSFSDKFIEILFPRACMYAQNLKLKPSFYMQVSCMWYHPFTFCLREIWLRMQTHAYPISLLIFTLLLAEKQVKLNWNIIDTDIFLALGNMQNLLICKLLSITFY